MITGRQIRAARALLEWSADDLAREAGITRVTISRIEADAVQPQEATLGNILRIFDVQGIEFIEDEGVRIRKNQIRVFKGRDGYNQFLDHIYEVMKEHGGVIRQFNLSDGENLGYAGDYAKVHLDRMAELAKTKKLDAKVLTIEGDDSFPATYCHYRWLGKENKILMPYYVYNDFIEMPLHKSDHSVEGITIKSKLLADQFVRQFDLLWDSAHVPPVSKKK